jgi:hypothetical protein
MIIITRSDIETHSSFSREDLSTHESSALIQSFFSRNRDTTIVMKTQFNAQLREHSTRYEMLNELDSKTRFSFLLTQKKRNTINAMCRIATTSFLVEELVASIVLLIVKINILIFEFDLVNFFKIRVSEFICVWELTIFEVFVHMRNERSYEVKDSKLYRVISQRELDTFNRMCIIVFAMRLIIYRYDLDKINYARNRIENDIAHIWYRHQEEILVELITWDDFISILQKHLNSFRLRLLDTEKKSKELKQHRD